jgi:hypothetical protein
MFIVTVPTTQPSSVGATSATNHGLSIFHFQVPAPRCCAGRIGRIQRRSRRRLPTEEITAIVAAWQAKAISCDTPPREEKPWDRSALTHGKMLPEPGTVRSSLTGMHLGHDFVNNCG